MLNSTILIKVKQRLNKLDSNDYQNIQPWQIVEAFNKAQVDWCRRNLHGLNLVKEGDEQSVKRVDDLQVLLTSSPLSISDRKTYYESILIPDNYLQWKRISVKATSECCKEPRPMVVYLAEQANVEELLKDHNKKPSFDWAETFATFMGNKIQIYTNGEFELNTPQLMYYKQPTKIQIAGVKDPYQSSTAPIPSTDVISDFKDDLVEVMIDECVKILAGDIESQFQFQREGQVVENNN